MGTGEQTGTQVLIEKEGLVAVVVLNRPSALNALSASLLGELADAFEALDADDEVRCIVLTGDERAFAAGGDIKQMASATAADLLKRERNSAWKRMRKIETPLVAAVSGYALGGGCELALACDMIVAAETATFGQPEIDIGVIPGAGGTQRLTRAIGKARAMELVLTGRRMSAREAFEAGLITRVAPPQECLKEAKELAATVAAKAPLATRLAKDAVLKAYEMNLEQGLDYERKNFLVLFSTEDKREGMAAFEEKRTPRFEGR